MNKACGNSPQWLKVTLKFTSEVSSYLFKKPAPAASGVRGRPQLNFDSCSEKAKKCRVCLLVEKHSSSELAFQQ